MFPGSLWECRDEFDASLAAGPQEMNNLALNPGSRAHVNSLRDALFCWRRPQELRN